MPYDTHRDLLQRARSTGHVELLRSPEVAAKVESYVRVHAEQIDELPPELLVDADDLVRLRLPPRIVLAHDGSTAERESSARHPSSRLGFLQVGGVAVLIDKLEAMQGARFVDPRTVRSSLPSEVIALVLPSSNVTRLGCNTVRDSWRAEIYEYMSTREAYGGQTFLDVLLDLADYRTLKPEIGYAVRLGRCPSVDCRQPDIDVGTTPIRCPHCDFTVYPTDILRIHEEVTETQPNFTALGRFMIALEHLILVSALEQALGDRAYQNTVAFMVDGPLAVHGPQQWMPKAIAHKLRSLEEGFKENGREIPLIIGVVKTGNFVEHGRVIRKLLPRRTVMSLADDYIYKHILATRSGFPQVHGEDTYYGQLFYYRTAAGKLITFTVPNYMVSASEWQADRFPGLRDALDLFDRVGTNLYPDALAPIAKAHDAVAIPVRTGARALSELSKKVFGEQASRVDE